MTLKSLLLAVVAAGVTMSVTDAEAGTYSFLGRQMGGPNDVFEVRFMKGSMEGVPPMMKWKQHTSAIYDLIGTDEQTGMSLWGPGTYCVSNWRRSI